MASRIRSDVNQLKSDLSNNKLSVLDASSHLYRIAQFDGSNNATLSNINNITLSNRKIYEDKFSMIDPIGPYKIDAIPMLCKETFACNRFSLNDNTDVLLKDPTLVNTPNYNEFVVFVPSNRTDTIYTPAFGQDVDNENNNLGSFSRPLEDLLMTEGREAQVGTTLWNKVNTFKTAITTNALTTTDASRNQYLNDIKNDPTYINLKANMKMPYKIWNQIKDINSDDFLFDNLLDLSGIPLQNVLSDGITKDNVKVTQTTWQLDASGNPTNILPIAQNTSATGGKMGLIVVFPGSTASMAPFVQHCTFLGLAASLGYVVVVANPQPLMGRYQKYAKKKTLCKLYADKSANKFGVTSAELNDPSNNFLTSEYDAYDVNDVTVNANGSFARARYRYQSRSSDAMKIFESFFYQIKAVLHKLGLTNLINYNNVCPLGISAGGWTIMACHNLLATNGNATTFTLNDASGNPITSAKPYLWNIKCAIGWQCTLSDVTLTKGFKNNPQETADPRNYNNRYLCGIDYLKVPYINITNDADMGATAKTGLVQEKDFYYNHQIQTLFQLTKQKAETNYVALEAFTKSINIMRPGSFHGSSEGKLDVGDGEYGGYFPYFNCEWNNGWYIPKYISFPYNNVIEAGLNDELFYGQLEDVKSLYAYQLMCHRFLGNDFPVNNPILASLGIKYDIAPTHCDILTDYEYIRVGPTNRITYDASYNIQLDNSGNKVLINIDASKNLLTDSKSIQFINRKLVNDKYTAPELLGPYKVECIPMVIKDKFSMPKFGLNRTNDSTNFNISSPVNNGIFETIDFSNNKYTGNLYDTWANPEVLVYVPSSSTSPLYTNCFRDGESGVGSTLGVGSHLSALEDLLLIGVNTNANTGSASLDASVNAFKTLVTSAGTTSASRLAAYNALIAHPDYVFLKNNMKTPVRVWNHIPVNDASGRRVFSYSPLNQITTDISDNGVAIPLQNILADGSYYTTVCTDSTWTLDGSGTPINMLPVAQNINALGTIDGTTGNNTTPLNANNKMGIVYLFNGQGSNMTHHGSLSLIAHQIASFGYVVVACNGNPLLGNFQRFDSVKTISKALAEKNSDPSGLPYHVIDASNTELSDSTGCYYDSTSKTRSTYWQPTSVLYGDNDGLNSTYLGSVCSRVLFRYQSSSTPAKEIFQRYFYQIKCILNKLGIHKFVNYNNSAVLGLSAGGFSMAAAHQLLTETPSGGNNVFPSSLGGGISTVFRCNNTDGTKSSIYPFLMRTKVMFNYQSTFIDCGTYKDLAFDGNHSYVNNRYSLGIQKLLVPMITFTNEYDATKPTNTTTTPIRDNFYNHQATTVYQLTQQAISRNGAIKEQLATINMANSAVVYRQYSGHGEAEGNLALYDGMIGSAFAGTAWCDWIKGWKIPNYASFPEVTSVINSGLQAETGYNQIEDIKQVYAFALFAHRFLGEDYPVPQSAFNSLGLRIDIGTTNVKTFNDNEYLKLGPKGELCYDASYNVQITAPGLTLTSVTSAVPNTSLDVENMTPIGSTTIKVDASSNLVLGGTKGLVLYDASGNGYQLTIVGGSIAIAPYP